MNSTTTSVRVASSPLANSLRMTDSATTRRSVTLDASYHVTRFIILYAEDALSAGQKPTWNGLIWFALPTGPLWPSNLSPQ